MTIEPIGIVIVILGLFGLAAGPTFMIYLLLVAALLQSAAALLVTSLGGASIQPGHLVLLFLVIALVRYGWVLRGVVEALRPWNPGFWLVLLLLYGVVSAFFMPRLFETVIYAFRSDRSSATAGPALYPLLPSAGNITQTVYFIGSVLCFLFVSVFARRPAHAAAIARALLFCACANLVFAALDEITFYTGTVGLLSPIRNANYRMLDDGEVLGLKRLVGTFPEASAYAFSTLGLLGFTLSLWLRQYRTKLTGLLSVLLLATLLLSTSSTAYAGSVAYLGLIYIGAVHRMVRGDATYNMSRYVFAAPLLGLFLLMLLRFSDGAWRSLQDSLDELLFNKMSTASGMERAMWNKQAMENFFDTYWLGAGLGSVRSSSFVTSLLGNVGLVGAITFTGFLATLLRRVRASSRADPETGVLREAACSSCLAFVMAGSISGANVDLGLLFCVTAALACPGTEVRAVPRLGAVPLRRDPFQRSTPQTIPLR